MPMLGARSATIFSLSFAGIIKQEARRHGATAQVAGGVPAMCDGVTQGTAGMELSLFSRDVIAMATAVALSHDMFDAALMLGVCDKIVPGLLIGALHFGHLPTVFVPAGPMPSGLPNKEKARVRELAAQGLVGRDELLDAELKSYHSPGTCTFYGTANSNQMLLEAMGLHVPGTAFVQPGGDLRDELTREAARTVLGIVKSSKRFSPIGKIVDEKAIVNAMVALLATGGSTNHLIHWVAVARAAGIAIDWTDFADLSHATPLLARVYPHGVADVNQFQAAGGPGYVLRELLHSGRLHPDVGAVAAAGIGAYAEVPQLDPAGALAWRPLPADSERHARAAQAHAAAGGAAEQGLPGRLRHRRAHERGVGQGAGGHPRQPRGAGGWPARQAARRRYRSPRWRRRDAASAGRRGLGSARAARAQCRTRSHERPRARARSLRRDAAQRAERRAGCLLLALGGCRALGWARAGVSRGASLGAGEAVWLATQRVGNDEWHRVSPRPFGLSLERG